MKNLKNKNVLVTGSSSGIGLEIGKSFLQNDCNVVFTGRNKKNLAYKNSYFFKCDLTDDNHIKSLFEFTNKIFNRKLDILICNLGSGKYKPSISFSKNKWLEIYNLNFFSTVLTIQKFLGLLEKSKNPSITCISSICGNTSLGCPIPYSTAKASLNHYVKNLSKHIAKKNIRINSISPGNILFKGSTWEKKIIEDSNYVKDYIEKNVPLNKIGTPKDISEMVLYLSSDSSKFITGSNIVIDGGQIA
ncbi:SDR family oxidoreductase [Alphaproteobacteria bacterium]|nr:SDR family oxidoreductase [Alphaproteobacteria bacterium]